MQSYATISYGDSHISQKYVFNLSIMNNKKFDSLNYELYIKNYKYFKFGILISTSVQYDLNNLQKSFKYLMIEVFHVYI